VSNNTETRNVAGLESSGNVLEEELREGGREGREGGREGLPVHNHRSTSCYSSRNSIR